MTDEQGKKKYLADAIGEDYKKWMNGNTIFLTGPTGSGKSFFIINIYTKWLLEQYWRAMKKERPDMDEEVATYYRFFEKTSYSSSNYSMNPYSIYNAVSMQESAEQNARLRWDKLFDEANIKLPKILYLVNRKVLKEQIEEQFKKVIGKWLYEKREPIKLNEVVKVETYQHYEEMLKQKGYKEIDREISQYSVIVLDEAHYFLTDSNFNTSSIISFDYFVIHCQNNLKIFISATFDELQSFIQEKELKSLFPQKTDVPCGENTNKNEYYECYSHIENSGISTTVEYSVINPIYNELSQNVQMSTSSDVLNYATEKDYDYINFHYIENDKDLVEKMDKGKWLIFVDSINHGNKIIELLEDKESERDDFVFIDAKYKKDSVSNEYVNELRADSKISERIVIATAVLDNGISFHDVNLRNIVIAVDTKDEFIQMLGRKRKDGQDINLYVYKRDQEHFRKRLSRVEMLIDFHYYFTVGMGAGVLPEEFEPWKETCELQAPSQVFLNDILQSEYFYNNAVRLCFAFQEKIGINPFSMFRLRTLRDFYENAITEIENDPYAFVKKQAGWLGIDFEEMQGKIEQLKLEKDQCNLEALRSILDKYVGDFDKDKNEEMRKEIQDIVCYFIADKDEYKNIYLSVRKKNTPISEDKFNTLMSYFGNALPYKMSKLDGKTFRITKTDTK